LNGDPGLKDALFAKVPQIELRRSSNTSSGDPERKSSLDDIAVSKGVAAAMDPTKDSKGSVPLPAMFSV
jgi:hypothetical protein